MPVETPHQLLREHFHLSSFLPGQLQVIRALLEGHSSLAVFPR